MTDPVISSTAIARDLNAEHFGAEVDVWRLASIDEGDAGSLCFVTDPFSYAAALERALERGAVVLHPAAEHEVDPGQGTVIVVHNPRSAFAQIVRDYFAPAPVPGVSATAVVHPTARIAASASVGNFSVIGPHVVIGERVEIRHHVVIGDRVSIGTGALIKSHAVIGEEGFGIDKDPDGNNVRLPHLGSVVLGEFVEVGNFTTVCSGTLSPSIIGDFSKIDDHVHVAHNVRMGKNVIVTACAEISGSVTVEDDVWIGPNASIIQGLTLGARSLVGMGSVVVRSVPADEVHFGSPAKRMPRKE